jgi:hypothetical protein
MKGKVKNEKNKNKIKSNKPHCHPLLSWTLIEA